MMSAGIRCSTSGSTQGGTTQNCNLATVAAAIVTSQHHIVEGTCRSPHRVGVAEHSLRDDFLHLVGRACQRLVPRERVSTSWRLDYIRIAFVIILSAKTSCPEGFVF